MTGIQPLQSLQVQCVAHGLCRFLLCTCALPQAFDSICVVPPASTGVHAGQQHVQLRSRVPTLPSGRNIVVLARRCHGFRKHRAKMSTPRHGRQMALSAAAAQRHSGGPIGQVGQPCNCSVAQWSKIVSRSR